MEIVVLSTSADSLLRYQSNRFPVGVYLPLAAFLGTASLTPGGPVSAAGFAAAVVFAGTLLFQFRLWDDLSDRDRDRREHPERLLARTTDLTPFRGLLVAFFVLNIVLLGLAGAGHRIGVFLALSTLFLIWYGGLRNVVAGSIVGYHVVLAKYPVIVYLVSDPQHGPGVLPLGLVYLCCCIYEALHDRSLPTTGRMRAVLAVEMGALAVVAAAMTANLWERNADAAQVLAVLTIAGSSGLVVLFRRFCSQPLSRPWPYAVFVISFCWLMSFSLGGYR